MFDAMCENEFIFPYHFLLSFCLGFSFKLEKLVDLPFLPMIMARC